MSESKAPEPKNEDQAETTKPEAAKPETTKPELSEEQLAAIAGGGIRPNPPPGKNF